MHNWVGRSLHRYAEQDWREFAWPALRNGTYSTVNYARSGRFAAELCARYTPAQWWRTLLFCADSTEAEHPLPPDLPYPTHDHVRAYLRRFLFGQ